MLLGDGRFAPGSDELAAGSATDELPFVNVGRWLGARAASPVPALYVDARATTGLLLLEDIGDTTLWDAVAAPRRRRAERCSRDAVDLLVALQVAGARASRRRRASPSAVASTARWPAWELEHFVEHGIETRHGARCRPTSAATLLADLAPLLSAVRRRRRASSSIATSWRGTSTCRTAACALIDFQDALLGARRLRPRALLTDRTTATLIDAGARAPRCVDALHRRGAAARGAAASPDGLRDALPTAARCSTRSR